MRPKVYLDEEKLLRNLEDDIENVFMIGECRDCNVTVYGKTTKCWKCGGKKIIWK